MAHKSEPQWENANKVMLAKDPQKRVARLRRGRVTDGGAAKRKYSLAHLTVIGLTPPEVTYVAARAGYDCVSLRLIPIGVEGEYKCISEDKEMIRGTKLALRETGIQMHDLELARILDDVTPETYLPAMEVAADLGARHVITSGIDGRSRVSQFFQPPDFKRRGRCRPNCKPAQRWYTDRYAVPVFFGSEPG